MKRILLLFSFLCVILTASFAQQTYCSGTVFDDKNKNGIQDKEERGIGNILVSNQQEIVLTDSDGKYTISVGKSRLVYIIKPSDYVFPKGGAPSYHHLAKKLVDKSYDFPLYRQDKKTVFSVLMLGDPQMRGEKPLEAFKEDIVDELFNYDVDFAMVLGDIADNDLSIYKDYQPLMANLPYGVYQIFGNHDADLGANSAESQSVTFIKTFGPDYYSLNEANVHFVVINNVLYGAKNSEALVDEKYAGGMIDTQFDWLKEDLKHVPSDKLIVLVMHIPMIKEHAMPSHIKRLFDLLKERKHLLALSGHLHEIQNYFFDSSRYWKSDTRFQNITIGATCGAWWTQPFDERNLPVATCMDGSPNGYYKFDFDGNTYTYRFIPANHREDFQMRITVDSEYIYANVFSATSKCSVQLSIDDTILITMKNVSEKDPFIISTYDLRYNFDNWRPSIHKTNHLWKSHLPHDLSKGVHRLKVDAVDVDGKHYVGYKLIDVN